MQLPRNKTDLTLLLLEHGHKFNKRSIVQVLLNEQAEQVDSKSTVTHYYEHLQEWVAGLIELYPEMFTYSVQGYKTTLGVDILTVYIGSYRMYVSMFDNSGISQLLHTIKEVKAEVTE